jgi:hypothetical protein
VKKSVPQKSQGSNPKVETVHEEFTGKNLTRFGGAGLIRRFLKRHRVLQEIEERVTVEGRRECKYSVSSMLVSLLYGMFLGYPRPGQMEILSTDKVFQKVAGLGSFPAQSTISRFLSGLKVCVSQQIASLNGEFLMKFRDGFRKWTRLTLDLDSHVVPAYGKQQRTGRGYNPKKKGRRSYHPLLCFIGETRDYLAGMLRSGKHHTSYQVIPFVRGILKKLPAHIRQIRLRADSGFFDLDLLKLLVKRSVEFYIVVPLQPWLQKKIWAIQDWRSIGGGVEVSELEYVLTEKITLRLAVIRKRVKKGAFPKKQLKLLSMAEVLYDYQVIVTNSLLIPEEVWRFYNQRACCENFIKEGIYGFGLDKILSHHYAGNYAYFELLMLGYNLMNFFKEGVLNQDKVKRMMQTIRERLFLIPARLIQTAGRWVLKQERSWFYRAEYEEALVRVT